MAVKEGGWGVGGEGRKKERAREERRGRAGVEVWEVEWGRGAGGGGGGTRNMGGSSLRGEDGKLSRKRRGFGMRSTHYRKWTLDIPL